MDEVNSTSLLGEGGFNVSAALFDDGFNATASCPNITDADRAMTGSISFWVEGVALCAVALLGICGNFISVHILSRDDMRNAFNLLLISLLCIDTWYLFGSVLESFRRCFDIYHQLHIIVFPYLLYPLQSVAMSASIFMTVGIALERYVAVHYPIDYNQSMNSPEACKKRLLKYLIPVVIFSFVFNIPKFLEAQIVWRNTTQVFNYTASVGDQTISLENETILVPKITVTKFRTDPTYAIYYNNWTRLAVLGIIPAAMLIYFNYKIWKDIKLRQDRRRQSMSSRTTIRHQARRRQEDNLAVVFIGFVAAFLMCHLLRIFLNLHESFVFKHAMRCGAAKYPGFPTWAHITTSFSHLLLALNSSTNMIIYCSLNQQFRHHFVEIVRRVCRCFGFEDLPSLGQKKTPDDSPDTHEDLLEKPTNTNAGKAGKMIENERGNVMEMKATNTPRNRNGEVGQPKLEKSELEVKNSPDGKSNGQAILHSRSAEGIDVTVDMPNGKADGHSVTHL